jgi:hypothetical protein
MDIDNDERDREGPQGFIGPLLPGSYLRIVPHPHSTDRTPTIIPIDSPNPTPTVDTEPMSNEELDRNSPWFPFRTRADFEVTEIAVKGLLPKHLTNNLLAGASRTWSSTGQSRVTLQNHTQMQSALSHARKYGVRVSLWLVLNLKHL